MHMLTIANHNLRNGSKTEYILDSVNVRRFLRRSVQFHCFYFIFKRHSLSTNKCICDTIYGNSDSHFLLGYYIVIGRCLCFGACCWLFRPFFFFYSVFCRFGYYQNGIEKHLHGIIMIRYRIHPLCSIFIFSSHWPRCLFYFEDLPLFVLCLCCGICFVSFL